jgi:hypothetical protein
VRAYGGKHNSEMAGDLPTNGVVEAGPGGHANHLLGRQRRADGVGKGEGGRVCFTEGGGGAPGGGPGGYDDHVRGL